MDKPCEECEKYKRLIARARMTGDRALKQLEKDYAEHKESHREPVWSNLSSYLESMNEN